jgi:type I restriction enzyme S subunit
LEAVAAHASGNSKKIKGRLLSEPAAGVYPAFSASGQDVWCEDFDEEGDAIVLSAVGARCGKAFKAHGRWSAIANTHIIRPNLQVIDLGYLWYLLNDEKFWERGGSAQPFVKVAATFKREVPVAPLNEQRRIVAKIEELFSKLDAGVAALQRAKALLKRFRQSVLKAAVTGELTRAWREAHRDQLEPADRLLKRILAKRRRKWEEAELAKLKAKGKTPTDDRWKAKYKEPQPPKTNDLPELPESWCWASLEQLGFVIGGLTKNPERARHARKLPYLRVANVYADELRLKDVEAIGVEEDEIGKLLLQAGDLLVVEGNGSVDQIGRMAVWDGRIDPCVHQNHIIKVRPAFQPFNRFTLCWLLSEDGRTLIKRLASSTSGLHTLSVSKVASIPVPLAPPKEQEMINKQVEGSLSAIDYLAPALHDLAERQSMLRQVILRSAFAGELVPQDPGDEPASLLMERIRGQWSTQAKRGQNRPARAREPVYRAAEA